LWHRSFSRGIEPREHPQAPAHESRDVTFIFCYVRINYRGRPAEQNKGLPHG
jgi:hypothetical protein